MVSVFSFVAVVICGVPTRKMFYPYQGVVMRLASPNLSIYLCNLAGRCSLESGAGPAFISGFFSFCTQQQMLSFEGSGAGKLALAAANS